MDKWDEYVLMWNTYQEALTGGHFSATKIPLMMYDRK